MWDGRPAGNRDSIPPAKRDGALSPGGGKSRTNAMDEDSYPRTRRAVLATAVAGGAAVAGCLGTGEDTETAETELDSALELMRENGQMLREYGSATSMALDGETPEFDHSTYETNVERARAHVDAAAAAAPETYAEEVELYREVLDYQVAVGEYNARLEEYLRCLETMESLVSADRWADAADHHGDCVSKLGEVETRLDTALEALEAIDRDALAESTEIQLDAVAGDLADEREQLPALQSFHEGFQSFLDGMTEMVDGMDALDADDAGTAKRAFSRAEGDFADATDTFASLEDDPDLPAGLEPDVVEVHCYLVGLRDAAGHFYDAAEAYERGDRSRYEAELEEAQAALEGCDY